MRKLIKNNIKTLSLYWVGKEGNLLCYTKLFRFLLIHFPVVPLSRHTPWIWRQNEVSAPGAQYIIWEESCLKAVIFSQCSSHSDEVDQEWTCWGNRGPKSNSTNSPVSINNWFSNKNTPIVTFPLRNCVLLRKLKVEGSLLGQVEHELLQNASLINIISWSKRETLRRAARKLIPTGVNCY